MALTKAGGSTYSVGQLIKVTTPQGERVVVIDEVISESAYMVRRPPLLKRLRLAFMAAREAFGQAMLQTSYGD